MIRALYTASTGMSAQQAQIDTTSNNLANVNTTAFKKDRAEFKDLMYQSQNFTAGATSMNTVNPTGIDIGLGTRLSNVNKMFAQGSLKETGNNLDMAITGKGFFKIVLPTGDIAYTRDGSFKLDPDGYIVNGSGFRLDPEVGPITNEHLDISIGEDGLVSASLEDGTLVDLGQIKLTYFPNPAGLNPQGNNLYLASDASGDAIEDIVPGLEGMGMIQQGFLEGSNVALVEEMMNLITAQRAYEANSKSVTTVDEMLQIANGLKR
jgi:flagellar basal-body rod protein FlgG